MRNKLIYIFDNI